MRTLFFVLCFLTIVACENSHSQTNPKPAAPATQGISGEKLHRQLYDKYELYRESTIKGRRFKHSDIMPLVQKLKAPFRTEKAGQSMEGRDIYKVQIGNGPVQVLLWSQMHGDEASATMALMDIFNFMTRDDQFNALRERLKKELTITFIPLLNPDGAERFKRRNAIDIDLNRDAARLQTPEAKLLKRVRDELKADWGFNLHDQNRYYSAGAGKTATFSFLAPAYNYAKDVNAIRGNAMHLIGVMNNILQEYIPGQVGRYSDSFEPRAFGDNIQKWGTSTVLIESGGLAEDEDKQEIRRLHFALLLSALDAIATQSYKSVGMDVYESIPFNGSGNFFDLLVREVEIDFKGALYTVDIGFRNDEISYNGNRDFYYRSQIADIGDLSIFHAYQTVDARGMQAFPGKTYAATLKSASELARLDPIQLLKDGYTEIFVSDLGSKARFARLPFRLIQAGKGKENNNVRMSGNPSLYIQKDGETKFIVVNGAAYDLDRDREKILKLVNKL